LRNKRYRFIVHNIHAYVIVCNESNKHFAAIYAATFLPHIIKIVQHLT